MNLGVWELSAVGKRKRCLTLLSTFFLFISWLCMGESPHLGPSRIFMCLQVLVEVGDADPEVSLGAGGAGFGVGGPRCFVDVLGGCLRARMVVRWKGAKLVFFPV